MKQPSRKLLRLTPRALVVHRETLRSLASIELAHARGGGRAGAAGTGPVDSCPPDVCAFGHD
jgi:hypothetical protein